MVQAGGATSIHIQKTIWRSPVQPLGLRRARLGMSQSRKRSGVESIVSCRQQQRAGSDVARQRLRYTQFCALLEHFPRQSDLRAMDRI